MLLYASKYHDVKIVVNLSGRYDLKGGIEERLGKDYMERIRKDGFIDVKKRSGILSINQAMFQCLIVWEHVVSDSLTNSVCIDYLFSYIATHLFLLLYDHLRASTVAGSFDYRVTEESLMDRLGTNMHEACLQIDKECRWGNCLVSFASPFWLLLHVTIYIFCWRSMCVDIQTLCKKFYKEETIKDRIIFVCLPLSLSLSVFI